MNFFRAFATVGFFTMTSRLLGFVRDILIAAILGASPVADAFFVAFKLPNFFRRLFAEGAFNAGFIPLFSKILEKHGRVRALMFAEQTLSILLISLFCLVIVMQIAMPWTMLALAPGFSDEPEKFDLAVVFTRLTFPYLLFISLVSLLGGILNSFNRFAAVAVTPVFLNISLITAVVFFSGVFSTPGHALAWAISIAGIIQLIWLLFACRREGIYLRLSFPRISSKIKELLKLMLPAALGAGIVQVNLVIDIILASLLPTGSISFLFYADRLNQLPIGVIGVAIGTALLPLLSRLIANSDERQAQKILTTAIEMALFLALPAMAAFVVASNEIVATLFQRGVFGNTETRATALALTAYATGLPAYVLIKVLTPAYFARSDTKTPVLIGTISMVCNIALNIILMKFLLHVGLALATALSAYLNVALLIIPLHKQRRLIINNDLIGRLAKIVIATLTMTSVIIFLSWFLSDYFNGNEKLRSIALSILLVTGILVFFMSAFIVRVPALKELISLVTKTRVRKATDE